MNTITRIGIISMLFIASLVAMTTGAHAATSHVHTPTASSNIRCPVSYLGNANPDLKSDGFAFVEFTVNSNGGSPPYPCYLNNILGGSEEPVANVTVNLWGNYGGSYRILESGIAYNNHSPSLTVQLPGWFGQCGVSYQVETIARYWTWWGLILSSDTVVTNPVTFC